MSETIKDKDCLESYIEDMVRYSIGVNRRRAIPDIKDSFKPVQRRILYSMNLLYLLFLVHILSFSDYYCLKVYNNILFCSYISLIIFRLDLL